MRVRFQSPVRIYPTSLNWLCRLFGHWFKRAGYSAFWKGWYHQCRVCGAVAITKTRRLKKL